MAKHLSSILKTETDSGHAIAAFSMAEVSDESNFGPSNAKNTTSRKKKISAIEREAYRRGFSKGQTEGKAEGLAAGFAEGHQQASQKMTPTAKGLEDMLEALEHIRQKIFEQSRDDILSLSLAIAREILNRESKEDQSVLLDLIQRAIQKIGETEKILIRLHPEDRNHIYENVQGLRESLESKTTIRIQTEESFARGDCIVEGEELMVDARRTTLLHLVEKTLRERV